MIYVRINRWAKKGVFHGITLYLKQEVWTGAPLGQRISNAAYLLVSQSILSVAIHDLAGWEPAGEILVGVGHKGIEDIHVQSSVLEPVI